MTVWWVNFRVDDIPKTICDEYNFCPQELVTYWRWWWNDFEHTMRFVRRQDGTNILIAYEGFAG